MCRPSLANMPAPRIAMAVDGTTVADWTDMVVVSEENQEMD